MQVLVEVEQFIQRDADRDERPEPGLLIIIHDTNTNSHTCDHSSRLGN